MHTQLAGPVQSLGEAMQLELPVPTLLYLPI